MTDQEQVEYSQLGNEIEAKKSKIAQQRRALKKAFANAAIGLPTNARVCNVRKLRHSTKRVPLVYGAKKRVVFIAEKGDGQCKAARIEVKK